MSDPTIQPFVAPGAPAPILMWAPIDLQGNRRPDAVVCHGSFPPQPDVKGPCDSVATINAIEQCLEARGVEIKGWTIRHRILASFSVMLALMVIMATVAYTRLANIERQAQAVMRDSLPGLYDSAELSRLWVTDFEITEQVVLKQESAGNRAGEEALQSNRALMDKLIASYEATVFTEADRENFRSFKALRASYVRIQDAILRSSADSAHRQELVTRLESELLPEFERGAAAIEAVKKQNRASADASSEHIISSVWVAQISVFVSLAIALGLAIVCGVSLLRAISRPLGTLNGVVDIVSRGDFTKRVTLARKDELGVLADGFNRMTDELTSLVGQVQKSGLQVNTSVVEIAATAKQQQATANEIAATTTEIGETSREISATSKELVKTMAAIAASVEQAATLASAGQAALTQMETTIRHVMDAGASVNGKLATLNEKPATSARWSPRLRRLPTRRTCCR